MFQPRSPAARSKRPHFSIDKAGQGKFALSYRKINSMPVELPLSIKLLLKQIMERVRVKRQAKSAAEAAFKPA